MGLNSLSYLSHLLFYSQEKIVVSLLFTATGFHAIRFQYGRSVRAREEPNKDLGCFARPHARASGGDCVALKFGWQPTYQLGGRICEYQCYRREYEFRFAIDSGLDCGNPYSLYLRLHFGCNAHAIEQAEEDLPAPALRRIANRLRAE